MTTRILASLLALVLALAAASPLAAASLEGQTFPDDIAVDGKPLRLNGLGIRTKFIVKVYIGALWLSAPSADPAAVIAEEGPKRVELRFLHSKVSAAQLKEAWEDGFRANAPGLASGERWTRFLGMFDQDVVRGDSITFTWLPGAGTEVAVKGSVRGTVEGADFMKGLFSVWFGDKPADKGLKKGMLGR
jgi:hypothetical protein